MGEEQGRPHRQGRPRRRRIRDTGRVRETERHLSLRSYCSYAEVKIDIKSLTHLGPSGREEGLDYRTFDKCAEEVKCGIKGGPVVTEPMPRLHCQGYRNRGYAADNGEKTVTYEDSVTERPWGQHRYASSVW